MEKEKEVQKKRIQEYKEKKRQTEELLANANYVDLEDLQNESMENSQYNPVVFTNRGPAISNGASKATDRDALEGYVEELSMIKGKKRAPPAV